MLAVDLTLSPSAVFPLRSFCAPPPDHVEEQEKCEQNQSVLRQMPFAKGRESRIHAGSAARRLYAMGRELARVGDARCIYTMG